MKRLKIITVADPMMGLLWETWPIHRKLETHFNYQIDFGTLMGQLVKDVYTLTDQNVLKRYGKTVALNQYWVKLMQIYLQEERIAGMPIQMGAGKRLFDAAHTTSRPLSKALRIISNHSAQREDQVLYELQYATVVLNQQTTDPRYLQQLAVQFGLDADQFKRRYQANDLELDLEKEQNIIGQLQIQQLPAYIVTYGDQSYVIKGLPKYTEWLDIIKKVSGGELTPSAVQFDQAAVTQLMTLHPHISSLELKEAFDVADEATVVQALADTSLTKTKFKKTVFYQR
ncbi:DsbA family protein [Lactiplantibacillus garii]|uniref:DsbA family protein n=1 Tax=Lactiplantibacillus garii TaxID=2306423 RepID=A0A3R8KGR5_9LACO|nr:DsbA family protein [Lactiplantibacillus garii]RRK11538.1 DsbA family protein [Lactiplantibacillus garii]